MSANNQLATIRPENGIAQLSYNDTRAIAKDIATSGLFTNIKTTEQAMVLMLLCQAKGLHPITAVERYDIVQGRPTMKSAAMQAIFQEDGGRINWIRSDAEVCEATFTHPTGGELTIKWDIARAKTAKLSAKDVWQSHPTQMLRARCVAEGVRALCPGVILGIYAPDELERGVNTSDPEDVIIARSGVATDPNPKTGPIQQVQQTQQRTQSGTAPVTPVPNVARDAFVTVAASCGKTFRDARERGEYANLCLSRPHDSRAPFTDTDWQDAAAALPGLLEDERREAASPAAEAETETEADEYVAPAQTTIAAAEAADEELTDPFAETPDALPVLPKKNPRDTGTPKGML